MNLSLEEAPAFEQPEERSSFAIPAPEPQPQKPPGLNIGLDIDDINKLYTYGGEQGSRINDG